MEHARQRMTRLTSQSPLTPIDQPPTSPQPTQCRKWQQAETRVGHFVLRNKWVPSRPEPTAELQAAPRVTHGSQRRGAAAALLAAGESSGRVLLLWWSVMWGGVCGLLFGFEHQCVFVSTSTRTPQPYQYQSKSNPFAMTAGGAEALLAAGPLTRRTRQQLNLDADDLEAAVGGGSGVSWFIGMVFGR